MDTGENETLLKIIEFLETDRKKVVLFHRNGDPDAVGSAVALSLCLPGITVSATGGVSSTAKNISSFLGLEFSEHTLEELEEFDLAIVLDTSSPSQLEIIPSIPKVVIDHHARNSAWEERGDVLIYYTDPEKRSCAEIIYYLMKLAGKKIPEKALTALLAGILTDTGHLTFAVPETLRTAAELLGKTDITIEDIHNALNTKGENVSKRIAKLKAAQRVRIEEFRGIIMAISEVNAFEGDAARALLMLGADVAWVGSSRKGGYRISARASSALIKKGFHLGKFLEGVGKEVNGQGGGHPGAAGLSGTGDAEAVLHICREKFKCWLREQNGNLSVSQVK
ncbi:MAG: DHH family phosphoesterase [Thermoplasmata archaeon]|nr:DHH family phosphoesterase [Thermoplasmata archaeon]